MAIVGLSSGRAGTADRSYPHAPQKRSPDSRFLAARALRHSGLLGHLRHQLHPRPGAATIGTFHQVDPLPRRPAPAEPACGTNAPGRSAGRVRPGRCRAASVPRRRAGRNPDLRRVPSPARSRGPRPTAARAAPDPDRTRPAPRPAARRRPDRPGTPRHPRPRALPQPCPYGRDARGRAVYGRLGTDSSVRTAPARSPPASCTRASPNAALTWLRVRTTTRAVVLGGVVELPQHLRAQAERELGRDLAREGVVDGVEGQRGDLVIPGHQCGQSPVPDHPRGRRAARLPGSPGPSARRARHRSPAAPGSAAAGSRSTARRGGQRGQQLSRRGRP